jgi:predicted SprT family Zn-dependent metalloprotease
MLANNLSAGMHGITVFNYKSADIVVNLDYCKDDTGIAQAIAHELAHIVMGTSDHGNVWSELMSKYYDAIMEKMERIPGVG